MIVVPKTLEETIAQAKEATLTALAAGYQRIQIELAIPEIALQAQTLALEFTTLFTEYGSGLKVFFPDTGAAALARRDWGETPFKVTDIGTSRNPVDKKVAPEDQIFLVVSPSAVEVNQVEKLCNLAGDRQVILLIPQLEDVAIVGIGYAARQLRERFISTLESAYYFRPLEGAIVLRSYPSPWLVYLEKENLENENEYELIAQEAQKPLGENLERIIQKALTPEDNQPGNQPVRKKPGILANLQSFLRALSQ